MSEFRPHVRPGVRPPPISDKSLLLGKTDLTPQERAEWLRKQSPEVQALATEAGKRYDLIQKATRAGLLGWEQNPNHYRNGNPYCKCPPVDDVAWGTVEAHNRRFDAILRSVDDGR